MQRPYDLPSLTALACFEAAARKASFKDAAQEMNVTPAAISHQIKALEMDLGCSLFIRRSRGVELTEKGAFLFLSIRRGFEAISETVAQMRERRDTVDVTIRTTTAVSSLWLTPKISAFWKIYPAVTVSQIISDIPGVSGPCDLSIHYGDPDESGLEHRILFQDRIVALGTTAFAEQYRIASVEDLLKVPLIHMSNEENGWTTWTDWLRSLGCAAPKGRSFYVNNYMIALQAAQDDVGAVLGWDRLVKSVLDARRLVPLVPESVSSPVPFHLKIHARATAQSRVFVDWLVKTT
ncbi:LysR family transcriptional regulator [Rhizobium sp. LjRoot98]|uniref:LysR family transcriptional regulator n=1 Tax=unclassified Rhizobium TaxID=2613769 RepID=UPI000713A772|nr:LysR family transcriptional regulator [Rhizobium sp. Root1204]KQV36602.1 LysR family transcriptional regulator [Rhizobium sp. Root1204]